MSEHVETARTLAETLESRAKTCLYEGHPSWNHDHCPGPECPHCERDRQAAKMLRETETIFRVQRQEIERLRDEIRKWRELTRVLGTHRTCDCKACIHLDEIALEALSDE